MLFSFGLSYVQYSVDLGTIETNDCDIVDPQLRNTLLTRFPHHVTHRCCVCRHVDVFILKSL